MADKTKIQWTEASWNPIIALRGRPYPMDDSRGWHCVHVSEGCRNCYAEALNKRLGTGLAYTAQETKRIAIMLANGGQSGIDWPLRAKKPRRIFVCSMTDLFGEWVLDEMIDQVFAVMALSPQHTFQVLTKRAGRMKTYLNEGQRYGRAKIQGQFFEGPVADWPLPNVWLGVSVEDQETADVRIPELLQTPAAIRWISYEPALGPVDFSSYLRYNPVHETKNERGVCLSRRHIRGPEDSGRRNDLETPQAGMGPVEEAGSEPAVQAGESGARFGRVLPGESDDRQQAHLRPRTQASMAPLHGTNSGGPNSESRERPQEGQHPVEPYTGDIFRATDSCSASLEGRSCLQPKRREEFHVEADSRTGGSDSGEEGWGREAAINSKGLRNTVPAGVQDREGREVGIDQIIVGGESGSGARPFDISWARDAIRQCRESGIACFVKQIGARPRLGPDYPKIIRHPKGGDIGEWPDDLRVREYPIAIEY